MPLSKGARVGGVTGRLDESGGDDVSRLWICARCLLFWATVAFCSSSAASRLASSFAIVLHRTRWFWWGLWLLRRRRRGPWRSDCVGAMVGVMRSGY